MLKFSFCISRFLSVFIALFLYASTSSARDFPLQTRATTNPQLVVSQSIQGSRVEATGFKTLNLDPSKTTLSIGGVDYTSKADVKVNSSNPDILSINLTLNQPLKAQANLEFKLSTQTKEGVKAESSSFADVAANLKVPNVALAVIPNDAYPESVITPAILEHQTGLSFIYRERDVTGSSVTVSVPVKALDEQGKLLNFNTTKLFKFSSLSSSGSSSFTAGVANIPVTLNVTDANQTSISLGSLIEDTTTMRSRVTSRTTALVDCLPGSKIVTPEGKVPVVISAPKSVGQRIGEFFSWGAMQALGLLPMVSGAIDCGKGAYALIANTEVDLLETEIGCVGMSLDAVMTAAAIADACATCPGYLANKSIMIFLKTVNRISTAAGGYLSRGILALFEKFRNGLISASEFIAKIGEFSGLKALFENGGEAALRDAEDVMGKLLALGCSVVKTRVSDRATPPTDCDPAVLASLVSNATKALQDAGLDPKEFWRNMQRLCGDVGKQGCIKDMERLFVKLQQQGASKENMKGLFYEAKWAAGAQNFGIKPYLVTTGDQTTYKAATGIGGAIETSEAELLSIRLSDGATVWDDVKSTIQWTDAELLPPNGKFLKDLAQAQKFARVAGAFGYVPRYAVYNTALVTCVAVRELIAAGIEVIDANTGLNLTVAIYNPPC